MLLSSFALLLFSPLADAVSTNNQPVLVTYASVSSNYTQVSVQGQNFNPTWAKPTVLFGSSATALAVNAGYSNTAFTAEPGLTRCGDFSCTFNGLRSTEHLLPWIMALKTEFRARVLVVDDEHAIAETLSVILTRSGFETAVAHDGREAVAKARSWRPDAIVSDVVMPVMDGIEAAIQIVGFPTGVQVVLLSRQAATSDLVKHAALKGLYFDVMAKAVHPTELLRELNGL